MPHRMARVGLVSMALVAGLGPCLQAQGLVVPGSDPVSIGRSGTGVAFGRSLEAAAMNPALLATLQDPLTAYVSMGMEHASQQVTQQANSIVKFSSDRNRPLPGLGLAWKPSDRVALGFRLGMHLLRHGVLPQDASVRFNGTGQDLKGTLAEVQAAFAITPALSVGVGVAAIQVDQTLEGVGRINVLSDGTLGPVTTLGLAEVGLRQQGRKTLSGFNAGLRYAINPRFTVGAAYRSGMKGDLQLEASILPGIRGLFAIDGFGTPPSGLEAQAVKALARTSAVAGTRDMELPGMLTLGFRHRINQVFTWEVDVRAIQSSRLRLPSLPGLKGDAGVFMPGTGLPTYKDSTAFSGMGEITLSKRWVARFGLCIEGPMVDDSQVGYLYGLGRQASFSGGCSWKGLGGEVSFGYQFRQSQDTDSKSLDGVWSSTGYRRTGTLVRVEGQGHLWSVGYKVSF